MKIILVICRIIVGSLFVISGLIKANDALGFSYKLVEYFGERALGMEYMIPYALPLAIFIVIGEILLGAAVLLGALPKLSTALLMFMLLFFSWLTYYTATCDPTSMQTFTDASGQVYQDRPDCVLECGCFGNAIALTPWESFMKDLILLVFTLPIFFQAWRGKIQLNERKDDLILVTGSLVLTACFALIMLDWPFVVLFLAMCLLTGIAIKRRVHSKYKEWMMALGVVLVCAMFQYYTLAHLPLKDYRPYAIEKSISEQMKSAEDLGLQPTTYYNVYTLKNKVTGEESQVDSDVYMSQQMWKDKTLELQKDKTEGPYVRLKGYEPAIMDFALDNMYGDNMTDSLLNEDDFVFIHFAYYLSHSNDKYQEKLNTFAGRAHADGYTFYGATASGYDAIESYKHSHQTSYEFLIGDGKVLKTVVRANPGLVVLKKGVVVNKWSGRDIPDYDVAKANNFKP